MPRKIKVKITKKVHSFRYGDKVFKPGDTLKILPQYFRADFMVKVLPPEKKVVVEEKAPEEAPVEVESSGEESSAEDPQKKKIKEKTKKK